MPHGRVAAFSEEVYEKFLEIRHGFGAGSKVVTVIEVLSPGNKAGGGLGRKVYMEKQRELIYSDTNLLEIDLLRSGAHTVLATLGRPPHAVNGISSSRYTGSKIVANATTGSTKLGSRSRKCKSPFYQETRMSSSISKQPTDALSIQGAMPTCSIRSS